MMKRIVLLALSLFLVALPMAASQFIEMTFDQVARESQYIVRGSVEQTWTAWDDAHEIIYTYATVRVHRYFGETTGPDILVVREIGGKVGDYTQEAIGFPAIRRGEQVVLMLSKWEDGAEFRIHAYNQGKYLVRNRNGVEVLVQDPVKQGDARLERPDRFDIRANADSEGPALTIDEFSTMVESARAGFPVEAVDRQ
jgi:hypothetical protein